MSIRKRAAAALAALLGLCVLLAILVMACAPRTETADVAILMYHAFTEDEADTGSLCTPASEFARQLSALRDAGYTSVGYADLIEFVNGEGKLPEKPLLISIDDGYQNNLDLAAPLLEKYGFCANIAVIGVSIGHTTYKDTDIPITPHFSLEDARPWIERGVLTVTTHSYDMHQVTAVDGAGCRRGVLQMRGEAEPDYIAALTQDYTRRKSSLPGCRARRCPCSPIPTARILSCRSACCRRWAFRSRSRPRAARTVWSRASRKRSGCCTGSMYGAARSRTCSSAASTARCRRCADTAPHASRPGGSKRGGVHGRRPSAMSR